MARLTKTQKRYISNGETVAQRWATLNGKRQVSLDRARAVSALTLPHITPPAGHSEFNELPTPYNDIGARAVNNLANKLFLTLFPVSTPFFQFKVSEAVVNQMVESGNTEAKAKIEKKLRQEESIVQSDLEVSAIRPALYEVFRDLIVAGDSLFHLPAEGSPNVYHIEDYVVVRAQSGKPLSIILKRKMHRQELEPNWVKMLDEAKLLDEATDDPKKDADEYDVYTEIYLESKYYYEASYISGMLLSGTEGKYPEDASAWLALRWNGKSGENYGRSYGYEYYGVLKGLEGYHKAVREHSAIASKTLLMLSKGSRLTPQEVINAPNGAVLVGEEGELTSFELGKYNDMKLVENMIEKQSQSISSAFLIVQARQAERVTAEEIRLMAQELETALGGAYSLLSKTLQEPLLKREIQRLRDAKKLKKFPDKTVEPKVIVGLEGLGKGSDLEKLRQVNAIVGEMAQVAEAIPQLNIDGTIKTIFNWVGLNPDGILYTDEELQAKQAEQQQAQQDQFQQEQTAQLGQAMIPEAMKGVMNAEDPQAMMDGMSEQVAGAMPQQ